MPHHESLLFNEDIFDEGVDDERNEYNWVTAHENKGQNDCWHAVVAIMIFIVAIVEHGAEKDSVQRCKQREYEEKEQACTWSRCK